MSIHCHYSRSWSAARVPVYASAIGLVAVVALQRFDHLPTTEKREPERIETAELYGRLIGTRWLVSNADGTLGLAARDAPMVERALAEAGRAPADDGWRERARVLETAYTSRAGKAVRRQIDLWNAAHTVLAVRDDRPPFGAIPALPGPIQIGDRPNAWSAEDSDRRPVSPFNLFIPESFRYVAAPARPGFSDWRAYSDSGRTLTLRTVVDLETPRALTIQVIGRLDAAASRLPAGSRVRPRCPDRGCPIDGPEAVEIEIPALPSGRSEIGLAVAPIPSRPLKLPDLVLAKDSSNAPFPRWERGTDPVRVRPSEPASTTIRSADGVVLWRAPDTDAASGNTRGRITSDALDADLLPLIGASADDAGGLAGILTRRRDAGDPATITLSIDMTFQRALRAALATRLDRLFVADDPYAQDRIAAAVAIDLETGDILGLAGYPRPPTDAAAWDYIADRAGGGRRPSVLTQLALNWISAQMALGSTMKPIIALTGLLSSDPAVRAMIDGCRVVGGVLPCAGSLRADAFSLSLPGQHGSTANFKGNTGYDTVARGIGKPRRDAACVGGVAVKSTEFGLVEAVRDSLNIWFMRLAEREDLAAAKRYDDKARRRARGTADELPDLEGSKIVEMMGRLGFFSSTDLAGAFRARIGRAGAVVDALHVVPARSALADLTDPATKTAAGGRETDAIDALAAAAIGQRVQAPVLTMARVAASIARRGVVAPRLLIGWNDERTPPTPIEAFPPGALDPLIEGMKAVPEVGTAAVAFSEGVLKTARCNLYGKTGTAEIGEADHNGVWRALPGVNSAWFIGWAEREALAAVAGPEGREWTRPFALAVFISHVHGDNRFGGVAAAPVMAELLRRLGAGPTDLPPAHGE